jgi:hypothetical protein
MGAKHKLLGEYEGELIAPLLKLLIFPDVD